MLAKVKEVAETASALGNVVKAAVDHWRNEPNLASDGADQTKAH